MPRYTAFLALGTGPGHYREVEQLVDAPDAQAAAQQVIDSDAIDRDDGYSLILIVEEQAVATFNCGPDGRAVSTEDDLRRVIEDERPLPRLRVLTASDAPPGT